MEPVAADSGVTRQECVRVVAVGYLVCASVSIPISVWLAVMISGRSSEPTVIDNHATQIINGNPDWEALIETLAEKANARLHSRTDSLQPRVGDSGSEIR